MMMMSTAVAPVTMSTISTVSSISSIALLCHVLINRVNIWTQKLFSIILISDLGCDWFEDLQSDACVPMRGDLLRRSDPLHWGALLRHDDPLYQKLIMIWHIFPL
jgi:hypothetical protein